MPSYNRSLPTVYALPGLRRSEDLGAFESLAGSEAVTDRRARSARSRCDGRWLNQSMYPVLGQMPISGASSARSV
ncbi:hypothetical protein HNP00_004534 [Arthrobacter sp. AZCC_0090]|nr:hypothetical protein [Arthrobacter sp. AZCC_0090]